jgi:hypothetical protein
MSKGVCRLIAAAAAAVALPLPGRAQDDPAAAELGQRVKTYFAQCFADLKEVAERQPTVETFRADMKPVAEKTAGYFGGTLIDSDMRARERRCRDGA